MEGVGEAQFGLNPTPPQSMQGVGEAIIGLKSPPSQQVKKKKIRSQLPYIPTGGQAGKERPLLITKKGRTKKGQRGGELEEKEKKICREKQRREKKICKRQTWRKSEKEQVQEKFSKKNSGFPCFLNFPSSPLL